jgi:hypothetical protein
MRKKNDPLQVITFDIPCSTEIKVIDGAVSQIYRGHPHHPCIPEDSWHDWVRVSWKCLDGRMRKSTAEISSFVDVNEQLFPNDGSISGYRGKDTYTAHIL